MSESTLWRSGKVGQTIPSLLWLAESRTGSVLHHVRLRSVFDPSDWLSVVRPVHMKCVALIWLLLDFLIKEKSEQIYFLYLTWNFSFCGI